MPWREDGDAVLLAVRLSPRSSKDSIGGIWRDEHYMPWLKAEVRAVPEKGRANVALIKLIAKTLNVAARDVTLEAGDTSRLKRIRITDVAAARVRLADIMERQD